VDGSCISLECLDDNLVTLFKSFVEGTVFSISDLSQGDGCYPSSILDVTGSTTSNSILDLVPRLSAIGPHR